jgi:hypothetical protein
MERTVHLMEDRKQKEEGRGQYKMLPRTRFFLFQFLEPPKIVPLAGDPVFNK